MSLPSALACREIQEMTVTAVLAGVAVVLEGAPVGLARAAVARGAVARAAQGFLAFLAGWAIRSRWLRCCGSSPI